jgi:anaerobic magnesium-protoporphyrin IX monomethyl ester cyclase
VEPVLKILLVKPPSLGDHIQPPLGLGYLASSVAGRHQAAILDMLKTKLSDENFRQFLAKGQYDLVGFQCYTHELQSVAKLARIVKQESPRIVTIAGGPHPTLLPTETMEYFGDCMDFLLRGEGDEIFPQFVDQILEKRLDPKPIPGLVWKTDGKIHVNDKTDYVKDLDLIPFPAWDLIQPQTYPPAQHGAFFRRFPIAPIITTRGCPFTCKFCSAPVLCGQAMRFRSPDSVLNEIRMLYSQFHIREFHIIDDNFTINKNHARAVLEKIITSKLQISLAFPNGIRIETVDESLLALMKKAGVYLISLGLESGSDRVLKLMNKKLTVEKNEEKIRLIRKANIDMAAFFIIGFPGETERDLRRTIDYSLRLPLLRANYENFLPLPGSPIYYELEENGELAKIDWRNFNYSTATYIPEGLTRKTLKALQREAFLRFFLRPQILFRHILLVKSFRHFIYLAKRFYHWFLM